MTVEEYKKWLSEQNAAMVGQLSAQNDADFANIEYDLSGGNDLSPIKTPSALAVQVTGQTLTPPPVQKVSLSPFEMKMKKAKIAGQNVLNKFTKSGMAGGNSVDPEKLINGTDMALSGINDLVFEKSKYADEQKAREEFRSGVTSLMMKSGNPILMGLGALGKAADATLTATGLRNDVIKDDTVNKGVVSSGAQKFNNLLTYIPGAGIGGKKISDSFLSDNTAEMGGAFGGTLDNIMTAQDMGGDRVSFLLGKAQRQMDNYVKQQNINNKILDDMKSYNTFRQEGAKSWIQDLNNQLQKVYFGMDTNVAVGKNGMKIQEFKDGGVIGVDSSVIPEGALHKELNHMEDYNEELDEVITDKGIAVVAVAEGGKIEQVAEIEKEELCIRKSLTERLEALMEEGTEEAMVKAGKLLAKEIMENTDDNTEEMIDGD